MRVYAYDLVITDNRRTASAARAMPIPSCRRSANPICSCSARATSGKFTTSSARNCARLTACPAPASPSGRRTPSASASSAISTTGTDAFIRCGCSARPASGKFSFPASGEGAHYKFEIRDAHGNIKLKTDPFGFFFEVAPKNAAIVWDTKKFKWTDDAWLKQRRERDAVALADEHL